MTGRGADGDESENTYCRTVDTSPFDTDPDWPRSEPTYELEFWTEDATLTDTTLRVSPTTFGTDDGWADALLEATLDAQVDAVRAAARDRFGVEDVTALRATDSRVWFEWLVEDAGVTALAGDYAFALAQLAFTDWDSLEEWRAHPETDPAHQSDREAVVDALRRVTTTGGARSGSVDDLVAGPLAALTVGGPDNRPSVTVEFDATAWYEADGRSADRAVDVLDTLASVVEVHLRVTSPRLARVLDDHFALGDRFTDAIEAARQPAPSEDDSESFDHAVWTDLEAIDPWKPGYGRILRAIPSDGHRVQPSLVEDHTVDLSAGAVSRYLGDLEQHDLLTVDRSVRPHEVALTPRGDAAQQFLAPDGSRTPPSQERLSVELSEPPASSVSAVGCPQQGREGGEATRRRSVEAAVADTGRAEADGYVQWLYGPSAKRGAWLTHERYAAPAQGTVTCVDATHIRPFDDGRVAYLSAPERDGDIDEVLAMLEWGGSLPTLARLVATLLSDRAFSKCLNRERLGDDLEELRTPSGERALDSFESSLHSVVVSGMQHGWFSTDETSWREYRDRMGGLRAWLLEQLGDLVGSDDYEARGELYRDLLGLLTSTTALYRAAGMNVTVHIRAPDAANLLQEDSGRRRDFLRFLQAVVPKQAQAETATGPHSHYRQAHEDRPEKRRWRRPLGLDESDDVESALAATPTVNWVLSGRTMTDAIPAIQSALNEELADRVAEGEERATYVDIDVRNGNSIRSMKRVIRRYAAEKGKRVPTGDQAVDGRLPKHAQAIDRLARFVIAATGTGDPPTHGNPMALAEGMLQLESDDRSGWLTLADIEQAVARLDPTEFLPGVPPSTAAFVQTLLASDEPLQRGDILDRTGFSTSAWEAREFDVLQELGIVQRDDSERYARYDATLEPWWTTTSTRDEPRVSAADSAMQAGVTEPEAVYEVARALGIDLPFEVLSWPADLEDAYRHLELERWRAWIWAAVASGDEYETGPPDARSAHDTVVRLGRHPTDEVLDEPQVTLANSAGAESDLPKVTDGGTKGPQ